MPRNGNELQGRADKFCVPCNAVVFVVALEYLGISRSVGSLGVCPPSFLTLRAQMLTFLTQHTWKWKRVQMFRSDSVPLLTS